MILGRLQETLWSDKRRAAEEDSLLSRLAAAKRFIFRGTAALACKQIAEYPETLEAARAHLIAPFGSSWIEIGDDLGFFWSGTGSNPLRQGGIMTFYWPIDQLVPKWNVIEIDLDKEIPAQVFDFMRKAFRRMQNSRSPLIGELKKQMYTPEGADAIALNQLHWLLSS